jgi:hypothetical protein
MFCLSVWWFNVMSICVVVQCSVYLCGGSMFCLSVWWFNVLSICVVVQCSVYLCGGLLFCLSVWWFIVLITINHHTDGHNIEPPHR